MRQSWELLLIAVLGAIGCYAVNFISIRYQQHLEDLAPTFFCAIAGLLALNGWRKAQGDWIKDGRFRANRCTSCGYDMSRSPDRCPECGAARLREAPFPVQQSHPLGYLVFSGILIAGCAFLIMLHATAAHSGH
jgi:hypothetical protein